MHALQPLTINKVEFGPGCHVSFQERMSLMQYILQEMRLAADHEGSLLFEPGVVDKVAKRAVDGHFWPVMVKKFTYLLSTDDNSLSNN